MQRVLAPQLAQLSLKTFFFFNQPKRLDVPVHGECIEERGGVRGRECRRVLLEICLLDGFKPGRRRRRRRRIKKNMLNLEAIWSSNSSCSFPQGFSSDSLPKILPQSLDLLQS